MNHQLFKVGKRKEQTNLVIVSSSSLSYEGYDI